MNNGYTRLTLSIAAIFIVLAAVFFAFSSTSGTIFMNKELSIKHQKLQGDCEKCHLPWKGVQNQACENCHKQLTHLNKGDLCESCHVLPVGSHVKTSVKCRNCHNTNTWKSQKETLVPVGEDPAGIARRAGDLHFASGKCQGCHMEHKGRQHSLTLMEDTACTRCHGTDKHTENDKTGGGMTQVTGLYFGHRKHFAQKSFKKIKCVKCHLDPERNDMFVSKINFKDDCGDCHTPNNHTIESKETETCSFCHLRKKFKVTWKKRKHEKNFFYSHQKHGGYECKICHEFTPTDKVVADIKAVDVQKCLGCHKEKSVNDTCGTCHPYHVKITLASKG